MPPAERQRQLGIWEPSTLVSTHRHIQNGAGVSLERSLSADAVVSEVALESVPSEMESAYTGTQID